MSTLRCSKVLVHGCVWPPHMVMCAVHRSARSWAVEGGGGCLPVPIVCPLSLQRARAASNIANECMSEYKDE